MKNKLFIPIMLLIVFSLACNLTSGKSSKKTDEPDVPKEKTEAPANTPAAAEPNQPVEKPKSGAAQNIDEVRPAVFQLMSTGTINDLQDGLIVNAQWGGSGFFIDPSGIGVTNNHVVAGAAILKAYVNGETSPRNVRVLGTSECADIAVVQVEGKDFAYLDWYEGNVNTGMDVYAAGFPLLDPEYNLTKGIISRTNDDGQTTWSSMPYIYSHDAKINPGNSGGPLVTPDGQVVGINYMSASAYDMQWAIPAEEAIPLVNQLRERQNVASIGLDGTAIVFGPNSEYPGIWVTSVTTGGIADKAGIKPGDIIHEVEDIVIASDGTMSDYCDILKSHDLTDEMKVFVYRWGTDELFEGSLNGQKLSFYGYAGLYDDAQQWVDDGGYSDSPTNEAFRLEHFDSDISWWTYFWFGEDGANFDVYQESSRMIFDIPDRDTYVYVTYGEYIYDDVRITANVENRGVNSMDFSLICRYDENRGWYEFNIGSDGLYTAYFYDETGGGYKEIGSGGSTRIKTGKVINEYTMQCKGNALTLWINGYETTTIKNNELKEGMIGMAASSYNVTPVKVEIDYLNIEYP